MHSENGHVFFPFLDFPFRILSFPELVCVVQHSGGELSTLGDNNSPRCIAISPPIISTVTQTNRDPQALKRGPNRDLTFREIGTQKGPPAAKIGTPNNDL